MKWKDIPIIGVFKDKVKVQLKKKNEITIVDSPRKQTKKGMC
jgi:hypothetical protein